jgi:DNA-binding response OmpR family regulator
MKILLVEDHDDLARVTCALLSEIHGHQVVRASTVASATAAVDCEYFDAALIDINLPDGDGYAVATEIRRRPEFSDTVLVALTGIGNRVDADRAALAGIDKIYTKPMDFNVLPKLHRNKISDNS